MIRRPHSLSRARRAVRRSAAVLICAASAWAAASAIERKVEAGEVVYVSRPTRKPGLAAQAKPAPRSEFPKSGAHFAPMVRDVSHRFGLDPGLVATVISVESAFNARAVSPKGARGLMQLMPATAKQYGVRDPHDPRQNVEGGVAYLSDLIRRYDGDLRLALAAYNAGPEAVEKAAGVPNYRETRDYLRKIEARYGMKLTASAEAGPRDRSKSATGAIRIARNDEGQIVATNKPGSKVTIVRRPGRGR